MQLGASGAYFGLPLLACTSFPWFTFWSAHGCTRLNPLSRTEPCELPDGCTIVRHVLLLSAASSIRSKSTHYTDEAVARVPHGNDDLAALSRTIILLNAVCLQMNTLNCRHHRTVRLYQPFLWLFAFSASLRYRSWATQLSSAVPRSCQLCASALPDLCRCSAGNRPRTTCRFCQGSELRYF